MTREQYREYHESKSECCTDTVLPHCNCCGVAIPQGDELFDVKIPIVNEIKKVCECCKKLIETLKGENTNEKKND